MTHERSRYKIIRLSINPCSAVSCGWRQSHFCSVILNYIWERFHCWRLASGQCCSNLTKRWQDTVTHALLPSAPVVGRSENSRSSVGGKVNVVMKLAAGLTVYSWGRWDNLGAKYEFSWAQKRPFNFDLDLKCVAFTANLIFVWKCEMGFVTELFGTQNEYNFLPSLHIFTIILFICHSK